MIPIELLRKIRRIQIRTSRAASDLLAGQYHSAFKGRGIEFEEVRAYQFGDDVRSIDWNVTARVGDPHVKVFREERELTVMLIVDVSASLGFGTRSQTKRDLVTEACATLAFAAIENNDKVGLLLFSDRIERFVPPRKGTQHVLRVIRELLVHEPVGSGTDLSMAMEHFQRIQRRRCTAFLVSDFLDERDWSRAVAPVRRRHDLVAIDVHDLREQAIPDVGLLEIRDAETGDIVVVDTASPAVRAAWSDQANAIEAVSSAALRKHRIDRLSLGTGDDFIDELRRFFKRREARMAR